MGGCLDGGWQGLEPVGEVNFYAGNVRDGTRSLYQWHVMLRVLLYEFVQALELSRGLIISSF